MVKMQEVSSIQRMNLKRRKLWKDRTMNTMTKKLGRTWMNKAMEKKDKLRPRPRRRWSGMRQNNQSRRMRNWYLITLLTKCCTEPRLNGLAFPLMSCSERDRTLLTGPGSRNMFLRSTLSTKLQTSTVRSFTNKTNSLTPYIFALEARL